MSTVSFHELHAAVTTALTEAEHRIRELRKEIDEHSEELRPRVFIDPMDHAKAERDLHHASEVHNHLMSRKAGLELALARIERGEFGTCLDCQEPIEVDRLIALPSASLCVLCQEEHERAQSRKKLSGRELAV